MNSQLFVPDQLIAGNLKIVTRDAILASGQNLIRGTMLGMITSGTATGTAGGGNVGNATIGSIAPVGIAESGSYTVVCNSATLPASWLVTAPDGSVQGVATSGTPFNGQDVGFLITAGGTASAVGDTFTITVPAGTNEVTQWAPAASNGSQTPFGILIDNVNASSTQQRCSVYLTGEFNQNSITWPTGYVVTEATVVALRDIGIFLKLPISGDIVQ